MSNCGDIFADLLYRVSMQGGVVRMDFSSFAPTPQEGKATLEHRQRIIMTPEAFSHTVQALNRVAEKMRADGKLPVGLHPMDNAEDETGAADISFTPNF